VLSKSKTISLGRTDRDDLFDRVLRRDGMLDGGWKAKIGTAIHNARISSIAFMISFLDKQMDGLEACQGRSIIPTTVAVDQEANNVDGVRT
jgi:hypothetical protein